MASKAGSQSKLHTAKKAEDVLKYLKDNEDPDGLDEKGNAPIHAYIQRQDKHRFECLMALLIHSKCDVDLENDNGNTALHLAAESDDVLMAKALLAFRADVNCLNRMNETPLEIAHRKNYESDIVLVLSGVGGQFSDAVMRDLYQLPALRLGGDADIAREDKPSDKQSKHENPFASADDTSQQKSTESSAKNDGRIHQHKVRFTTPDASVEYGLTAQEVSSVKSRGLYMETPDTSLTASWVNVKSTPPMSPTSDGSGSLELSSEPVHSEATKSEFVDSGSLYTRLVENTRSAMNKGLEASTLMGDEGYAAWLQYREVKRNMRRAGLSTTSIGAKKSASLHGAAALKGEPLIFRAKGGERVLCLDGGGVKGLVQIEILSQIESASGRRIIELFDWIVGTSTGGILALALVYVGMSLDDLRCLYFELKNEVFKNPKLGYGCDTVALERILKRTLGEELIMMDKVTPKVMIAAVDKSTTALNLTFFNNCFNNKYSRTPVWKVARYTSAAPIYFSECDNYVDGGVLANNPCDYALTDIQNFFDESNSTSKIACVVSVGCGSYPPRKVDSTDLPLIAVGKKTKITDFPKRLQSMITLLTTALTKSEDVARNCQSRCEKQGIPFFRFSPELDEPVTAIESNDEKLCDIIVKAQMLLQAHNALDELIQHFYYTSAFDEL